MVEQLNKYPRLRASRLHQMVQERGYPGGPDHFRAIVARHRPHVDAFRFFGRVPRKNLYDNLKSGVLERAGDAIRFHPTMLELSSYYRFLPRPVAVARGNEKGRVERAIRYIRDSFFAARTWARKRQTRDSVAVEQEVWCSPRHRPNATGTRAPKRCTHAKLAGVAALRR